ncbi:Protein max [Toxocara canis]|uniref:Protein max n=1 Tax=Toxocara canis TaxID=6265 RepID=A0A0B2W2K3_TOXCA|nr:Protein max [Toxocara canis]
MSAMSDAEFSDADEDVAMDTTAVLDTKKHARAQHNALERRRRDNIKDMYGALKDTIPGMSNERASRAVVLKKAIDMIVGMEERLKSIVSENEQLEQINAELENELARLEGAAGDGISHSNESVNRKTVNLDFRAVPDVKSSDLVEITSRLTPNGQVLKDVSNYANMRRTSKPLPAVLLPRQNRISKRIHQLLKIHGTYGSELHC